MGILGKLSGKLLKDERSAFCDTTPSVRPLNEKDGDNTEAARQEAPKDA